MIPTTLTELPDLQPRDQLDTTLTIRLTTADREQLERTASELDVPVGRLLRAIARRALAEVETT